MRCKATAGRAGGLQVRQCAWLVLVSGQQVETFSPSMEVPVTGKAGQSGQASLGLLVSTFLHTVHAAVHLSPQTLPLGGEGTGTKLWFPSFQRTSTDLLSTWQSRSTPGHPSTSSLDGQLRDRSRRGGNSGGCSLPAGAPL